ncbi:MAG: Rrf2 family transcriptional regulator [Elusimicrobia bacterium]|nr:Rrf2 family transcriptional regulator [Elusimicrobiota bacterium]
MKLSTRARYGTRAMLELALLSKGNPVMLKEIAKRQGISERYLEQILIAFITAGLVKSVRGKQGGFFLTKNPSEIRLSDIVKAAEGDISLIDCIGDPKVCRRTGVCVARGIWEKLRKAMLRVLNSVTLQDMVEMHRKKVEKSFSQMYYI